MSWSEAGISTGIGMAEPRRRRSKQPIPPARSARRRRSEMTRRQRRVRRRRARRVARSRRTGRFDQLADQRSGEALFGGREGGAPATSVPGSQNESSGLANVDDPREAPLDSDVPRSQGDGEGLDDPSPVAGHAERPTTRQQQRRKEIPRRQPRTPVRRGILLVASGVALMAAGVIAMQFGWLENARDIVLPGDDLTEVTDPPEDGWQPTVLLTTVDEDDQGQHLRALAVLSTDRRTRDATIVLIPATIVADVPGFGSFTLREAWEFGGSALVAVTVDNLLGIRLDGVLAVDQAGFSDWFDTADGAVVDIAMRVSPPEGSPHPAFGAGEQHLTAQQMGHLALATGQGQTELDVLSRTRQVLDALLRAIAEDHAVLDAVIESSRTLPGTVTPDRFRTVLTELAEANRDDRLTAVTVPVVPLGSGQPDLYRSDEARLEALLDERFTGSRDEVTPERLAVQILNGNGRTGVGQAVADHLADGGYRIVLTGNADRFNHDLTRIIVYSDEPDVLRAAQRAQERLGGIGTIERSGTPQSVVDLTIVVGHDFSP